jgi:hypothetical protein
MKVNLELSVASVNIIINALTRWAQQIHNNVTKDLIIGLRDQLRATKTRQVKAVATGLCAPGSYTYTYGRNQAEDRNSRVGGKPVDVMYLDLETTGPGRFFSKHPNKSNVPKANTGIVVEAMKEIGRHGVRSYRITKVKALRYDKLPREYLEGECVWQHGGRIKSRRATMAGAGCYTISDLFTVGTILPEHVYKRRMAFVEKCGDRLGKINVALNAKRKAAAGVRPDWDGTVKVKI